MEPRRRSLERQNTPVRSHREVPAKGQNISYNQRLDRHGNPFGERVATRQTRNPPPGDSTLLTQANSRQLDQDRERERHIRETTSPQYVHKREHVYPRQNQTSLSYSRNHIKEWREKPPTTKTTSPPREGNPQAQNQGLILNTPLQPIPTMEEVMEDLHAVTRQYLSCEDPTESAARKQRVLQGDAEGQMEKTAEGIIAAAIQQNEEARVILGFTESHTNTQEPLAQPLLITLPPTEGDEELPEPATDQNAPLRLSGRKRGRPAKLKSYITSPKSLSGVCSRKRNLAKTQSSPGRRQRASPSQSAMGNTTAQPSSSRAPPKSVIIPAITKKQPDFHDAPLPGP